MHLVEVEPAKCQHLHSSNYDPAKVARGRAAEPLTNGQMYCFDCEEFFVRVPLSLRYTLADIRALAREYADEHHNEARLAIQQMSRKLCEWIERREKEQVNADNEGR